MEYNKAEYKNSINTFSRYFSGTVLGIPLLESPEYNQLANGVLAILCLKFINDGEKVVRKIFGFQDDNSATSFGAGLAVGMLAINNAKKIGTSTRKGLNTISKATGKYGNRFKNGLNTMTPNFQLGSKIESLSKNVKNAPTNAQNAIKGKFKNSKAGQKLSKLKNRKENEIFSIHNRRKEIYKNRSIFLL